MDLMKRLPVKTKMSNQTLPVDLSKCNFNPKFELILVCDTVTKMWGFFSLFFFILTKKYYKSQPVYFELQPVGGTRPKYCGILSKHI